MSALREAAAAVGNPERRIISWRRLLVSLAAGAAGAVSMTAAGMSQLAVLVGWAIAASAVLGWVWRIGWPQDDRGTKSGISPGS